MNGGGGALELDAGKKEGRGDTCKESRQVWAQKDRGRRGSIREKGGYTERGGGGSGGVARMRGKEQNSLRKQVSVHQAGLEKLRGRRYRREAVIEVTTRSQGGTV